MEIVEQTFKVFDNFLEITPAKALVNNSTYEIRIKGLKAANKNKVLANTSVKVVTELTPSYCSINGINALVEVFEVPEDRLLYYIREASRHADYIMKGSALKLGVVPFEVEQFVKTKASLEALLKTYVDKASESGSKGVLGDITFENSDKFEGIKDLIELLKAELKNWEFAMRGYFNEGRAKPVATRVGMKAGTNSIVPTLTIDSILNDITRTRAKEG